MPSSFSAPVSGDPYNDWATPAAVEALGYSNVIIESLPGREVVGYHYYALSPNGVIVERKRTGRWRVQWLTAAAAAALQAAVGAIAEARTVYSYAADGSIASAASQLLPAYTVSNQRNANGTYDVVIEAAIRDWSVPAAQ